MKRIVSFCLCYLAGLGFALAAVNINTASVAELDAVKGIGETKAKAIVDYRTKHGPYKSVDDLRAVKGFGEKTLAKLKPELTVDGAGMAKTPAGKPAPAKPAGQ